MILIAFFLQAGIVTHIKIHCLFIWLQKHKFCFECIENWSKHENSCPLCKTRFLVIEKINELVTICAYSWHWRVVYILIANGNAGSTQSFQTRALPTYLARNENDSPQLPKLRLLQKTRWIVEGRCQLRWPICLWWWWCRICFLAADKAGIYCCAVMYRTAIQLK